MTLREAFALFDQYKGKRLTVHDLLRLRRAAQIIRASRKIRNPKLKESKITTLPDGRKFPVYKGEVLSRVPGSVWTWKDEQEGSPRLKRVLSTMTRAELQREYNDALRGSFDRVFKAGGRYFKIVEAEMRRRGLKRNSGNCPTCGRSAGSPYRVYDSRGKVVQGCVDVFHKGHVIGESARWLSRPEARRIQAVAKRARAGKGYVSNPRQASPVRIYSRILRIEAQKTQPHRCDAECRKANHCYFHDFTPGGVIYGLPNGDVLIRNKNGKRLWKMF